MKALFGLGLHPNAGAISELLISQGVPKAAAHQAVRLGRPFVINDATTELQRRLAVAYRDHNLSNSLAWNTPIEETLRAQMRTTIARELFAETYGRPPSDERELTGFIATQSRDQTTSTAGYDLTFSPVKSFSVLWALAPNDLRKILEECHERAVADTLEWLQDNAAFTRMGAQGVAQIDVDGFIAAQFTHRDSRAGDPDLHTHVAISNKVRGRGPDGIPRWLALDGRPIFKSNVAASEFYNTRIEAYSAELAGLVYAERPATERGKRPVREIVDIPTDLCDEFSSRRVMINDRYTGLAKQFQADHGREPTTIEAIALYERANLETRTAKHEPRSLAEQRQMWRAQAIAHLGSQQALSAMLVQVRTPKRRHHYPLSTSQRSRQRGEVTMVRRATSRPQRHLPWRRLVGSDDAAGNPLHCRAAHAAHAAVFGAVEHQSGLVPCQQLVPGKRIGSGYQVSGAVRTYLKRSQVAAFGLPGVSGRLVVTAGGQEVAGRTAGGSNRVRLTLADLVDVHGVETGRQDSGGNRLDGDSGIAIGEIEGGRGHVPAVSRFQVRGERSGTWRRAGRRRRPW